MYRFWILQIIFSIAVAVPGNELLPERFLKPRNFNYHPYTDVGIPAALKKQVNLNNPYVIVEKLRLRQNQNGYQDEGIIFYPTPHTSVVPKKQIETNEISKYEDPASILPKNYAFTYTVKNQLSGDDFSHSQAHNGKATRGQYRVKLPDGRTQVVSYTADHKGYRADVQYEENAEKYYTQNTYESVQHAPETPTKLPEILPHTYQKYNNPGILSEKIFPIAARHEPEYLSNPINITPLQIPSQNGAVKILIEPQSNPEISGNYKSQYSPSLHVTTAPGTYHQPSYVSSTLSPQHITQQYVSFAPSTQIYNYQNLPIHSSTAVPQQQQQQHEFLVTARPIYGNSGTK